MSVPAGIYRAVRADKARRYTTLKVVHVNIGIRV